MAKEIFVAKSSEFSDGARKIVGEGKSQIGVYRVDGNLYAYSNLCPHQGGPACEGLIIAKVEEIIDKDRKYRGMTFNKDELHIVCPWHGWEYKLKTGVHAADPKWKLRKYDVVEREGEIFVVA